ncbi:Wall-associated receptor kinase 2-like protein [Drosera capensis]
MFRPNLILHIHWLLLLPAFMAVVAEPTTMVTAPNTTKPGCRRKCGNLTVPYPFGIGLGGECSFNSYYNINCNETFNPPKAFIGRGNLIVMDIQPTKMRIKNVVASRCNVKVAGDTWTYLRSPPYFFSETDNKLIVIGCNDLGLITGTSGHNFTIGCATICATEEDVRAGACSGLGCCQTSIPKGMKNLNITLKAVDGSLADSYCGHAFLAEADRFVFHGITDLSKSTLFVHRAADIPIVVDWLVAEQGSCSEAEQNKTAYACQNNTNCIDIDTDVSGGGGYRCDCLSGYEGNPYLIPGCTDINECEGSENPCSHVCTNTLGSYHCSCRKGFHGDGLKNGSGCSASLALHQDKVLIVSSICFALRKRKVTKMKAEFFRQNGGLLLKQKLFASGHCMDSARIFTAKELKVATKNFSEERILGRGGYGMVYQGILSDGSPVAIKKSKLADGSQVEQFINEVIILAQVNHRNVVKLLGCCLETEMPLLVYEFISNGSLLEHIHGDKGAAWLSWSNCLRIASEAANALAYLHSAASIPIIHRDVKSANILIDESYTAKMADFGASRLVPMDKTQVTTLVQGTLGYLDPEYLYTSQLTEKSDVYGFGVVLAELLTREKPLREDRRLEDRNLSTYFVTAMKEDRLFRVLYPRIVREANQDHALALATLVKACLSLKGEDRPTMKEVASELERLRKQISCPRIAHHVEETTNTTGEEIDLYPIPSTTPLTRDRSSSEQCTMRSDHSLIEMDALR